ncbi:MULTISPECIES: SecY-interacting protein [unclassified Agarivorans]|uniref:SecY-interacting protein n=1 Tax=unclassified Agarivorans TaxID=2636026 RepID=UPI0026E17517|nr:MULTISPECIES: SecY-interacting protein [unclassified Agarivorans]MDO6687357.1 SecY-interacting protein [Agarivorans sp. 3_MG-2023]MDO6717015.1 SecY-interacting protein [Agarivorans sp. 2_MG-2023]
MSSVISKPLTAVFSKFEREWQNSSYPQVEYDNDWLSPCTVGEPVDEQIHWHPVLREQTGDFSGIEAALELTLHPSIKAFYGDYFSETLAVDFQNNRIELVQAWNEQDFDMLLENIIGHVLMQRRLKQNETVFIASTDDEMQVVSINNDSGEVVLEQLGKGIDRVLASSLDDFLAQLTLAS